MTPCWGRVLGQPDPSLRNYLFSSADPVLVTPDWRRALLITAPFFSDPKLGQGPVSEADPVFDYPRLAQGPVSVADPVFDDPRLGQAPVSTTEFVFGDPRLTQGPVSVPDPVFGDLRLGRGRDSLTNPVFRDPRLGHDPVFENETCPTRKTTLFKHIIYIYMYMYIYFFSPLGPGSPFTYKDR